jgi:S-methylmethionine-dependent homocysteine/selenocysteine methylase
VAELHREYAAAGASVLTANTFRTRPDDVGAEWSILATQAVELAKTARGDHNPCRIAGSIAPHADCYRPDLASAASGPVHAAVASVLAQAGVDLLLLETFPHIPEALAALEGALSTGIETWLSFTAGPNGDLLSPDEVHRGAEAAVRMGATAILVNCIPAGEIARFLPALEGLSVPFGAYANAGSPEEGIGWTDPTDGPRRYADIAETWIDAGATIIGSCCGTGPSHTAELKRRFSPYPDRTTS